MAHVIEKSALVWHSAEQMYDLVNDIGRYPDFLPWCASTEIHEENESEIVASIDVARSGVRHRLTTRNRLKSPSEIRMSLVEGPFRNLGGTWEFLALDEGACKVILRLNFEFSGSLARMTFGRVFSQAANTMVDAFCQRAHDVYGSGAR
ncbi:type II toxin-antitoxin system RatA family toxin [Marinobacter fonticola]|uniref:type II toxin-antitoxin system RatA family toxin n=1 Tax=Marinobacter fonticola TaxID=2603215 RepID=UPI0011E68F37|nr:type II toxin-antitoxin system RatA family toxin [Marinobacter fonticola]